MTPITTLLVANRGEITCRVFRSAAAMGMRSVAVFVSADKNSPHLKDADEAVRINSYLDSQEILAAAHKCGVNAVHPGYGFLAESATFAKAVLAAGLIWVGPSPQVIELMGSKLAAKNLAQRVDIPVLPSATNKFASLGFPLLIKAVAGGGGKGMRVVQCEADLPRLVATARREAGSAFLDDTVYAERFLTSARHIEVQILGDKHGNIVHLGERECSIQRRHQKVIEEAPSPFVDIDLRLQMTNAALRLAKEVGYDSVGTVEFLVDNSTNDFFFLEVNARLQVEHPVTEEVTGIDLVREQLRVAQGEKLAFTAVHTKGHSIEARLCSEDPSNKFLPTTGTIEALTAAASPAARYEVGVTTKSPVTTDFDPMIAKVITHGETRHEAAARLALALARLHIAGVTTNRDFLVNVLRSKAFLDGDTTIDFLERYDLASSSTCDEDEAYLAAVAVTLWQHHQDHLAAASFSALPSGFRVGRLPPEWVDLRINQKSITIHYSTNRDGGFALGVTGDEGSALLYSCSQGHIDFEVNKHRRRYQVSMHQRYVYLTGANGGVVVEVLPRFVEPQPVVGGGAISAPMPGKVIEVFVSVGDVVEPQQVLVVLEAMKMENHLRAPQRGTVSEILVEVGQQVEKDELMMVIDSATREDGATTTK